MNPTLILIFILLVSILYVLVQRHKKEERERLEKSKKAVTNLMKIIPKKMKKIMKKADETFPSGAVQLAATIACVDNTKLIEAFEDIKDIRYGKLGASNSVDGATTNKWIKISSFTVSGAWDPRGFTLEVYPRIRTISSSRQTLVCLVRNADKDIEAPYVSLTTHNEAEPNSRFIKDVRVVRTGGSGITSNTVEVWIQMSHPWANTGYVMYYLYNFNTKDFIATVPQAQSDNPPAGQSWGISENIEPQNGKYPIKASKIKVGDKWTMSGVGDAHGNDDWLRLFGADEKGYYGGFAAGNLWSQNLWFNNNQYGTMNVTGGNIGADAAGHEFRHANRTQGIGLGYNTIYATGSNTDQDLGLKARGAGKVRVVGDAVVNGKLSLNRNALNFSNAEWDKNHNIYNNVWNLDKEGAWDGMKINSYAGLRVRVGDSNSSAPKTALEVTDSSTTVKDVFCINKTCINESSLKNVDTKKNIARYIRVGNTDGSLRKDYWTLVELRAYDQNGNNVAAGKPVKILEGRKWANQTPPERIVDGQVFDSSTALHDNWYKGYHGDTGLNVLEIDLGAEINLSQVELFNRWNADIDWRMDGTTIEFIGADGKRNRIIYTGLWHRQYSKEYIL